MNELENIKNSVVDECCWKYVVGCVLLDGCRDRMMVGWMGGLVLLEEKKVGVLT